MQTLQSTHTCAVEVVRFSVKNDVTVQQAEQAAITANEFIAQQPGFIRRTLSRSSDGNWIDIVEWNSLAEALETAQKAMEHPATAEFFGIIDQETLQIYHAETVFAH